MLNRRSVLLLIETSNAYARGLLDGIISWQHEHELWSIDLPEQERGASPATWLDDWHGDGVIARIETVQIANTVRRMGVPTVDVSAARHIPDIPCVETDDEAIAELAVKHLIESGFHNVAFCGVNGFKWSTYRELRFVELAKKAGAEVFYHRATNFHSPRFSWKREREKLESWVQTIPKPVGVLCCYDIMGQQLIDVCRQLEVAVPEQVSVLGVDNDSLLCNLCTPRLSSVRPDTKRTGYVAAQLLHDMMSGKEVPPVTHTIAPLGIATRHSTDVLAIDDEEVISALRFIRDHATEGIRVSDVVRCTNLSRRSLENRFTKVVGRSPHQEIERLRIERVKQLLRETDIPLANIAERSGFRNSNYLSVAFKRMLGVTPGAFRRHRVSDEAVATEEQPAS